MELAFAPEILGLLGVLGAVALWESLMGNPRGLGAGWASWQATLLPLEVGSRGAYIPMEHDFQRGLVDGRDYASVIAVGCISVSLLGLFSRQRRRYELCSVVANREAAASPSASRCLHCRILDLCLPILFSSVLFR
jgi:hypothetical protein